MDPKRFDALTRSLVTALDRRRAIQAGLAGLLSGAAAARGLAGAEATDKKTCSPDECTGDATCQKQGGPDCVCLLPEAGAETDKPAKGTCGKRGPATCSPKACEPGAAGDEFCQTHGGDGCVCVRDEAQGSLSGTPATGTCGTGGGPVTCLAVDCAGDEECAQGVPGGCVCQDGTCGPPCEPRTCAEIGADCGVQPDGCDGTIDCGTCRTNFFCDNGRCRPDICVPQTREEACAGVQCGTAEDGCRGGQTYTCGTCPKDERCLGNRCVPDKDKRCPGKGLAGQPCTGKCRCKNGRRCHNGRCCEPIGDGSVHCNSDSDCCPGLTCARKAGGRHKTCLRKPIGRATIPEADITAW